MKTIVLFVSVFAIFIHLFLVLSILHNLIHYNQRISCV